jgi:hypothetical protein
MVPTEGNPNSMTAPHSSARYAVIRGSLIGAPTGANTYSVVAVHEVWGNGVLVSQMTLGTPVTYTAPVLIVPDRIVAMLRNSADATAYASRLRQEDHEADR